ncbi:hypothetical protein Smic_16250 [Streptomyces microflavus]|uniref:HTH tetR-type domain-containing protein n=1 Tax=Streptomyces microflavus TaxID=1919 RepID=A0A7J0CKX0_STRMI|nr:hypothetical protein Smic_16250 [Streptomyces microflavus]
MARRYDPERRTRIIDAALRVIAADGIAGLSHRTVAAEADVPLGSTTYHFGSLDELLTAALRRSNENFAQALRDSEVCAVEPSGEEAGAGLADELTRVLGSGSRASGARSSWSTSCISPPCAARPCDRSPPSGPSRRSRCCPRAPTRPPHGPSSR